ncbi:DUF977 family protein, partial [Escherichia coli]|uniref:DUF977 family protein n=1 Tax=Escherichia coli TaxID=562 RepID=UPI00016C86B0
NERMTISQLERATGAGWHSVRRCLWMYWLAAIYTCPVNTVFLHQNRCIAYGVRQRRKQPTQTLIRKLPDGEIRRYDRQQNIICGECRKSEVMLRVLAFYQGNFQEAVL